MLCRLTLSKQINTMVLNDCGHNVIAIFMSFSQLSSGSLFEEETEL